MFVPADDFNSFSEVNGVTWSPDGKCLASASDDRTVKIWTLSSTGTWVCQSTVNAHSDWVRAVSWSPCGKWLASGGDDEMIYIYDAQTFKVKCPVTGHSRPVTSVAWNNDGTKLVSGSWDKTVKIWSVGSAGTFECQSTLNGHSE